MKHIALIPALLVLLLLGSTCGKESKNPAGPDSHDIPGLTFVTIPGGTFQMGDVENVTRGDTNEKPVHSVTISGFEMSAYEITNAQYSAYLNAAMASGDIIVSSSSVSGVVGAYSGQEYIFLSGSYSSFPDARCWITYSNNMFNVVSGYENWPVVYVSWYGAKAFTLYYGLDLPSESEWEYACRGGKQYEYGTDDGTMNGKKANCGIYDLLGRPGPNNINHSIEVGSYQANPYGLYDMSGNVLEWCHDWYWLYPPESMTNPKGAQTGSYRIKRGGSWYVDEYYCRSASRAGYYPTDVDYALGFRVVRRPGGLTY